MPKALIVVHFKIIGEMGIMGSLAKKFRFIKIYAIAFAFVFVAFFSSVFAMEAVKEISNCGKASPLSDDQIKEIVSNARARYKDIPAPFSHYVSEIQRRNGCYYIYSEYPIPTPADSSIFFMINRRGEIVDISTPHTESLLKQILNPQEYKKPSWCSSWKEFSKEKLDKIVANERAKKSNIPPPFPKQRIEVLKKGCLYWYQEITVEPYYNRHLFEIDPTGEVISTPSPH